MQIVANRKIASPHDAPVCLPRRAGQVEMVAVDEHRIAEVEDRAGDVSKLERRIGLGEAQLSDSYQSANGIWVRDSGEAEIRLRLGPSPGSRQSFARAP